MKQLIITIILIIITYFLLNKYLINYRENLCINPRKCGTTELENVLQYDWQTEPNNPFYTNNMVIPQLSNKYSGENIKNQYLINANKIYSDIDNDILNANLVPKTGTTFIYP
jgi:hypothetical protein